MTDFKTLTDQLAVSVQITPEDVAEAARQGFTTIINNRPDGEQEGQPGAGEIEAAARAQGLDYAFVPMVPGQLDDGLIDAFAQALAEAKGPVLAFCRTGTRSATLWALAEAGRLGPDAVIAKAAEAGYDLAGLRRKLEARAG